MLLLFVLLLRKTRGGTVAHAVFSLGLSGSLRRACVVFTHSRHVAHCLGNADGVGLAAKTHEGQDGEEGVLFPSGCVLDPRHSIGRLCPVHVPVHAGKALAIPHKTSLVCCLFLCLSASCPSGRGRGSSLLPAACAPWQEGSLPRSNPRGCNHGPHGAEIRPRDR